MAFGSATMRRFPSQTGQFRCLPKMRRFPHSLWRRVNSGDSCDGTCDGMGFGSLLQAVSLTFHCVQKQTVIPTHQRVNCVDVKGPCVSHRFSKNFSVLNQRPRSPSESEIVQIVGEYKEKVKEKSLSTFVRYNRITPPSTHFRTNLKLVKPCRKGEYLALDPR
jgi:hypothetical protein